MNDPGLCLAISMEQKILSKIRAIGRQQVSNKYYRVIHFLLKVLKDILVKASNDMLIYYHSKKLNDSYYLAQNCARRIEQAVKRLKETQAEALSEWQADLRTN